MPFTNAEGKNLVCPRCGSIFIDYDYFQRRWRCLMRNCGWIQKTESDMGNHSNLLTIDEFNMNSILKADDNKGNDESYIKI